MTTNLDAYLDGIDWDDPEGPPTQATSNATGYVSADYEIHAITMSNDDTLYHVVNKKTGVVEHHDQYLPRSIGMMIELQAELEKAVRKYRFPLESAIPTLKGEDDEGEAGLH